MNKKVSIDFVWNTLGTTLNAFNSLFYLVIITRINGMKDAGVFTIGFAIACLLYMVGTYSGRVFQVTDNNDKHTDIDYFNMHIITIVFMILLGFLYCFIRKYELYKFIIIMLLIILKALEAFSESFYATIQKNDELQKVGISLTLKALISIILFFIIDFCTKNIIYSILSVLITNILIIILYDSKNAKIMFFNKFKFNKNIIIKLLKSGFYTFLLLFLNLYLINISKYAIDYYLTSELQTIYSIIIMPTTVVSMFALFLLHPFLLKIKSLIEQNDMNNLICLLKRIILAIFGFGVISILLAWLFGIPVLNFIYNIKLNEYLIYLLIVIAGSIFYSIISIFSNVLITFRKTLSQVNIYLIVVIISTIITFLLVKFIGISGAVFSYFFTMIILFFSFLILTYVIIKKAKRKC